MTMKLNHRLPRDAFIRSVLILLLIARSVLPSSVAQACEGIKGWYTQVLIALVTPSHRLMEYLSPLRHGGPRVLAKSWLQKA
ncbi:hypothetical protein CDL15_Pgr002212 [Punica granatum]|uniref:Secreted protein n=1 Tax=Punica granatum TaxID=22663 RepID=A0A218XCG5_PUNGR|nr:hypothetical protein CDL15_Pgr002212 [Punica granatum]PKI32826.1 hypothetical protein CRG98_046819 [Punica granatum]